MFGPVVLVLCQFIFYLFVICLYKKENESNFGSGKIPVSGSIMVSSRHVGKIATVPAAGPNG